MNDHNSLRISTRIPRTWRILLFRSVIIEIDRYDGGLLLNEHGDRHFLFHNFGAQIMPCISKIVKEIIRRKKRYSLKRTQNPLPRDVNYDLENNDSTNVLSRRRSKLSDFFHKL